MCAKPCEHYARMVSRVLSSEVLFRACASKARGTGPPIQLEPEKPTGARSCVMCTCFNVIVHADLFASKPERPRSGFRSISVQSRSFWCSRHKIIEPKGPDIRFREIRLIGVLLHVFQQIMMKNAEGNSRAWCSCENISRKHAENG